MIFDFRVPTIEDNVNFAELIKKPGKPEWSSQVVDFNDARENFKKVLSEAYLKHKSFGELFSTYKDTVEAYMNVNVDLMRIMCKSETAEINLVWTTFIDGTRDYIKTVGGNEEAMAIELIMVRYCWAFAYFRESDGLISKLRDKLTTTFKSNSATLEEHT